MTRRERAAGFDTPTAVERAVPHVGRALVTTSMALGVGFFAFSASPWKSVASFGVVASIAILAALVAVLVVLPALIQCVTPFVTDASRRATASTDDAGGNRRAARSTSKLVVRTTSPADRS